MAIDTKVAHIDREVFDKIKELARNEGFKIGPYMTSVLRQHLEWKDPNRQPRSFADFNF